MKKVVLIIILIVIFVAVFVCALFWQNILGKITGGITQNNTIQKYDLICSKNYYPLAWHMNPCDPEACGKDKYIKCIEGGVAGYKYFIELCEKTYSTGCVAYASCSTWKEASRKKC